MKEWVYVVSNSLVPSMVKVAHAPKDPKHAVKSLNSTAGIPTTYVLDYEALLEDGTDAKRRIEKSLSWCDQGNGWFKCSPLEAVKWVRDEFHDSILFEDTGNWDLWLELCYSENQIDATKRAKILSRDDVPKYVLQAAISFEKNDDVLWKLAINPLTDEMITQFDAIWSRCTPSLQSALALKYLKSPAINDEKLEELLSRFTEKEDVIKEIISHPNATKEFLTLNSWCYSTIEIHDATEKHSNWDWENFKDFMLAQVENEIASVIKHPGCSGELLLQLVDHKNPSVSEAAILSPKVPGYKLIEVSYSGQYPNLEQLALQNVNHPIWTAKNKNTSQKKLEELAMSSYVEIKLEVAKNLNCPPDLLTLLSTDENYEVRATVASNTNCAIHILETLSTDESFEVRLATAEAKAFSLTRLKSLLSDKNPFVRTAIALRRDIPKYFLLSLLQDEDIGVLNAVVEHPNRLAETFYVLSASSNCSQRLAAAKSQHCPFSILEELTKDSNDLVRRAAMRTLDPNSIGYVDHLHEPIAVLVKRFRDTVVRTLGAVIEESELLRLAKMPADKKNDFIQKFPIQAEQLALFEKYILPRLDEI